jgi:N-acetylneuraminic acid mutarotase
MASVNGLIYLYGGLPATGQRTQDLWKYDPATNQWTQLPNGPNPRERGSLVEVGGLLYLVGGRSTTEPLAQPVQCYDPVAGTWTAKASMSQIRYDATVVAIGTLIYLHGGFASADNNMLWVYDTVADTWGVLAPNTGTGNARSDHWAGVVDGKMYVGGGNSQTNTDIYKYDPDSNVWIKLKAHTPRQFQAVAVSYNGKVYVHGGSNTPMLAALWQYTP